MRLLKPILVWVMLLLWLPATSLCLVERAGWLTDDDCCPSDGPKSAPSKPSSGSPCCTLASATYKANDYSQIHVTVQPVAWALITEIFSVEPDPRLAADLTHDVGPPTLLQSWQFVFRTASPPRAPSLA